MLRKIRFIAGMILTLFVGFIYVDHVVGVVRHLETGIIRILDWFLVCLIFHVIFFALSWFAGVKIGLPRSKGNTGALVAAWIFFVLGLPVVFVIKLAQFVMKGGLSQIFPSSGSNGAEEYAERRSYTSSQNDGRRRLDRRDFEIKVEEICNRCAHGGRTAIYSNAYRWSEQSHRINDIAITPEVDFGEGEIVVYIVFDVTLFHEDGQRECSYYQSEPDLLFKEISTLIIKERKMTCGLDCAWNYRYNIKFE